MEWPRLYSKWYGCSICVSSPTAEYLIYNKDKNIMVKNWSFKERWEDNFLPLSWAEGQSEATFWNRYFALCSPALLLLCLLSVLLPIFSASVTSCSHPQSRPPGSKMLGSWLSSQNSHFLGPPKWVSCQEENNWKHQKEEIAHNPLEGCVL